MLWNIWNQIAAWQRHIKVVLFEVPHFTTLYLQLIKVSANEWRQQIYY